MKRKPDRYLTSEEVLRRCRTANRAMVCAGQVIVLITLLERSGWPVVKLAKRAGVSRQLLGAVLAVNKFPTTDKWWRVARAFGLRLHQFDKKAEQEADAALLP